jgi:hypothetical protein
LFFGHGFLEIDDHDYAGLDRGTEQRNVTAEIAAALDCTPKAVENRLYRARQLLQRSLFPAA